MEDNPAIASLDLCNQINASIYLYFFHNCEVALFSCICFFIRLVFHQHLNSHIVYPGSPPEPSNHSRGQFLHLPSYICNKYKFVFILSICIYTCIYIFMFAFIFMYYICIYICICICVYTCISKSIFVLAINAEK